MEHAQGFTFAEPLILLAAAVVAVPIFRFLRLGSILGYLAAGLVIGPHGFKLFTSAGSIMQVAELGIVLFLFLVGLELNVSRLWAMRRDIFVLGTAQVAVTGPIVMLYPLLVVGRSWQSSLVAGLGLALSSTALVMQLLEERAEVQTPHGQKAFAILLLQDLAVVPLLALVAILAPVKSVGGSPVWQTAARMLCAVSLVVVVGRFLLTPLFRLLARTGAREIMTAAALLVVIAAAALMTFAGLSPALGAFLAGMLLAESSYRHELEADIEPFRGLLLGLFFLSVGMTVEPAVILRAWRLLLGALVALTLVKVGLVYLLVRLTRAGHATSVRTAMLLSQGGEFGFVLYATAVAAGVMTAEHATLLTALVTMSMALTPLLAVLAPRLAGKPVARTREEEIRAVDGGVVLVGFGRFGQVVSQMLLPEGVDVTTIDNDVEMIEAAERFGFRVYYGDGTRIEVLRAAGAEHARLICVCVTPAETATKILEVARAAFPLVPVYVRAYDRVHALELLERHATYQQRETYDSAITFGRDALEALDVGTSRIAEIESEVRERDSERFALQQQGGIQAGRERMFTRPVPRPEPLVNPKRRGVALNPEELSAAAAEDDPRAEADASP